MIYEDLDKDDSNPIGKAFDQRMAKMFTDWEELVFNLSRLDGILKPDDFEKMSIYKFYRHKSFLTKEAERKKKQMNNG